MQSRKGYSDAKCCKDWTLKFVKWLTRAERILFTTSRLWRFLWNSLSFDKKHLQWSRPCLVSTMNHFIRCHVLIGQEMRWHVDYI